MNYSVPFFLGRPRVRSLHGRSTLGLALVALAALLFGFAAPARALVSIDVTHGEVQPLPIAIPSFAGDTDLAPQFAAVIANDLAGSGLFNVVDRAAYITPVVGADAQPNFADWRAINAQALVAGTAARGPDGMVKVEFRLWDTVAQQQVFGEQYSTKPDNWRRIAHIVADAIYERLTGEAGYFDTRVAFIAESGPKNARTKRLALMDQDGQNVRYLTDGRDLVLTPRFSPSEQQIAYMSYANGTPRIYLLDLNTGKRRLLGNFPHMTFAPRFSPDGRSVVMSLEEGGNANIYAMDLATNQPRRLTESPAIDTSPSYSPDGSQIVFESDRGGSQQLYVMNADGSNVHRISFGEGSYSTPVWSPRGDLIAFTKQLGGSFAIGVMAPDGNGERILTQSFHNEGPTWAPNGRVLMFFRDSQGPQGGPSLWTVDVTGRNERRVPTGTFASDPAWSPRRPQ